MAVHNNQPAKEANPEGYKHSIQVILCVLFRGGSQTLEGTRNEFPHFEPSPSGE